MSDPDPLRFGHGIRPVSVEAALPAAVASAIASPEPGRPRTILAGEHAWHAIEWGLSAHAPIVLVHGVTSDSGTFWRVGPALAAAGWYVVAVDLPGHGRTGGWRGRSAFDEIAADLSTCITEAQLERTELVVLGHSLGGIVSAWLPAAGIVPDKLILLDPPVLTTVELEAMTRDPEEQPPMGRDGIATATQALRAAHPDWSDGDVMAKVDGLLRFDVAAVRAVLLGNGAYDAGLTGLANPAARDVAVWYIRGEPASGGLIPDDHVPAIEARVGPDHLVTIAGAGHSPQRTHIHSLVAAILNALA